MENLKHCLIIDDDTDDQEIFLTCLNKIGAGVSCLTASNGVEAMSLLRAKPEYIPHYIFIDVNMPKMNGIECLKNIKAISRLNASRIFMYSTTSEKRIVTEIKDLGAEDFIIKPVRTAELKQILFRIFGMQPEPQNNNT